MTFPTEYQHYIYKSRYAKWLPEKQRREEWHETVDRYLDFINKSLFKKHKYTIPSGLSLQLRQAILNCDVMPSMRALMTAGIAAERDEMALYNCSYLAIQASGETVTLEHERLDTPIKVNIKNPVDFDEGMYILLCGTGLGFSVERQFISELPTVGKPLDRKIYKPKKKNYPNVDLSEISIYNKDTNTIHVHDSKYGWASGLRILVVELYNGNFNISWDLSQLRPAGSPLKTFGGYSSGPEPLSKLFKFVVETFKKAEGRKLTSLEVHDIMCSLGECVVVGGVRRSAEISLSNLSDQRMREAKAGNWWIENVQRSIANNSVAYTEKPDIITFNKEWLALMQSGSGERGIFNRSAVRKKFYEIGREYRDEVGTNPCLAGDTLVETVKGRVKIKDIKEPTYVYSKDDNGKLVIRKSSASFISKKNAPLVKVTTNTGVSLRCTPDHKIFTVNRGWVEAKDLKKNDRLSHLSRSRRGSRYSGVKLTTDEGKDKYVMEHRLVWEGVYGALPEGFDVHHMDGDTYNNSIDNLEMMCHASHAKLTATEQPNNHQVRDDLGKFVTHEFSRKGKKEPVPMPDPLKTNIHQYACVVSVVEDGAEDVYDITVEDTHNFVADNIIVHNCGEILLRSAQLCNLTEAVIRSGDTLEDMKEKVRLATILGTFQSIFVDFKYVRPIWSQNCSEERLLGVSLTGIMDRPTILNREVLTQLRETVHNTNRIVAHELKIPASAAMTCVKPSGTVSQLVDSSSGIHTRYSKYYIRRVRGDKKHPLTRLLEASGVPCEEDVTNSSTLVFSFPQKAPDKSLTNADVNAITMLETWLLVKEHWCDHNPSITIHVKNDEWLEVGAWVYEHFDEIGGVSFLPYSEHTYRQAPYEAITEDQYYELVEKMPTIKWDDLSFYEEYDQTTSSKELACSGDSCEIADIG